MSTREGQVRALAGTINAQEIIMLFNRAIKLRSGLQRVKENILVGNSVEDLIRATEQSTNMIYQAIKSYVDGIMEPVEVIPALKQYYRNKFEELGKIPPFLRICEIPGTAVPLDRIDETVLQEATRLMELVPDRFYVQALIDAKPALERLVIEYEKTWLGQ